MKPEVEGPALGQYVLNAVLLAIAFVIGIGVASGIHDCPEPPTCLRAHEVHSDLSPMPTIEISPAFLKRIDTMERRLNSLEEDALLGVREPDKVVRRCYRINKSGPDYFMSRARFDEPFYTVEVEGAAVPCERRR